MRRVKSSPPPTPSPSSSRAQVQPPPSERELGVQVGLRYTPVRIRIESPPEGTIVRIPPEPVGSLSDPPGGLGGLWRGGAAAAIAIEFSYRRLCPGPRHWLRARRGGRLCGGERT